MKSTVKAFARPVVRGLISGVELGAGFQTDPTGYLPNRLKMLTGRYETFLIQSIGRVLPKGGVFADVGANVGYISRQIARRFQPAKLYVFEPNPRIYPILKRNLGALQNCELFNVGLGAAEGGQDFYHGEESCVGSFVQEYTRQHPGNFQRGQIERSRVRIATADSILSSAGTVDAMKMDVEGYEIEVLKGMAELLAHHKIKTIFFEFCPFAQKFTKHQPEEIIHLLLQAGYVITEIEGENAGVKVTAENIGALVNRLGANGYTTLLADAR